MDGDEMRRALARIAEEVVERQRGTADLALIGIQRRGVPLAARLARVIEDRERTEIPVGSLDITFHRDDLSLIGPYPLVRGSDVSFDVNDITIVLVDDVLYTGRTIRAAMDALFDLGRPRAIRLAVLVDRGHRELPINPDHVGRGVPTAADEAVQVRLEEIDGEDSVVIEGISPYVVPAALTQTAR